MFVVLKDIVTQLFNIPTGEFSNFLLMGVLIVGIVILIKH